MEKFSRPFSKDKAITPKKSGGDRKSSRPTGMPVPDAQLDRMASFLIPVGLRATIGDNGKPKVELPVPDPFVGDDLHMLFHAAQQNAVAFFGDDSHIPEGDENPKTKTSNIPPTGSYLKALADHSTLMTQLLQGSMRASGETDQSYEPHQLLRETLEDLGFVENSQQILRSTGNYCDPNRDTQSGKKQ